MMRTDLQLKKSAMVQSIRNSALQLSIQAAQSISKTKAPPSAATTKGIKKLMDLRIKRPSPTPSSQTTLIDLTDEKSKDAVSVVKGDNVEARVDAVVKNIEADLLCVS